MIDLLQDMDIGSLYLAQNHPIGDDTSIDISIVRNGGSLADDAEFCAKTPMEGFVRCDYTINGRYIFLQIPATATQAYPLGFADILVFNAEEVQNETVWMLYARPIRIYSNDYNALTYENGMSKVVDNGDGQAGEIRRMFSNDPDGSLTAWCPQFTIDDDSSMEFDLPEWTRVSHVMLQLGESPVVTQIDVSVYSRMDETWCTCGAFDYNATPIVGWN